MAISKTIPTGPARPVDRRASRAPDPGRWGSLLALCPAHQGAVIGTTMSEADLHRHFGPGGAELLQWTGPVPFRTPLGEQVGVEALPDSFREEVGKKVRKGLAFVFGGLVEEVAQRLDRVSERELRTLRRAQEAPELTSGDFSGSLTAFCSKNGIHGWKMPGGATLMRAPDVLKISCRSTDETVVDTFALVGAHGERFSRALIDAVGIGSQLISRDYGETCRAMTTQYRPLLEAWTFRGTVEATLLEALTTNAGVNAILAYHRVPGRNARDVLAAIADSRLADRLAKAPGGIVGPFNRGGFVPVSCVAPHGARLRLSDAFEHILERTAALRDPDENKADIPQTHHGCPVASHGIPRLNADGIAGTLPESAVYTLHRSFNRIAGVLLQGV